MNLHEYQAKQLFRSYGIAVSNGVASDSVEGAKEAALSLGGESLGCQSSSSRRRKR